MSSIARSSAFAVRSAIRPPPSRPFTTSFIRLNAAAQSSLETSLRNALKSSMKARDKEAAGCLKSVLADMTYTHKLGADPTSPVPESSVVKAIRQAIAKRKDASASYDPSSPEHASLTNEISLLSTFLPSTPSETAVRDLISSIVLNLSVEERKARSSVGTVLGKVLEGLGAGASAVDRKEVGKWVREGLGV